MWKTFKKKYRKFIDKASTVFSFGIVITIFLCIVGAILYALFLGIKGYLYGGDADWIFPTLSFLGVAFMWIWENFIKYIIGVTVILFIAYGTIKMAILSALHEYNKTKL